MRDDIWRERLTLVDKTGNVFPKNQAYKNNQSNYHMVEA